jgi:hypothetical protein
MYKGGDSRYPAYLTLEKDIAEEDADDPSSIIPLYAHPSPSAPVDIAEIIAAGDAMSRALMLNERYNVDGGLDEGMNRSTSNAATHGPPPPLNTGPHEHRKNPATDHPCVG